ncbi:MAG TPA: alpha/beta hydrolase domain-containing protein [Blastocatellia bacterium]|nr:alpha/beta hydrolase domain-containing protein [Blastocatellia bacterium]
MKMKITRPRLSLVALALALLAFVQAQAGVTRIEIISRADLLGGKEFGAAGAYEKIVAKVYFAVDPNNPHNKIIVDLDKAQRNEQGLVEFSADLYILRPKELNRGNGAALFEIPNRGGKAMVRFFNHGRGGGDFTTEAEMGDGFLMRRGFTLVWLGWQFDVPDGDRALRLYAPAATDNGKPITGRVRSDFVFNTKVFDVSLGHRGQKAQPAIDPDSAEYKMTVRDSILGERRMIPRGEWRFARFVDGQAVPDPTRVYLKSGFEPGKIYEVVYRTQNPTVVGLGLAAVRDLASYFKYERNDVASVKRALGFGISQSGRYLRHFLYQGFNADEKDRQVFDAVNPHVAGGGHGSFNHRFAEASRDASQFSTFFYPTDIFPFTDLEQTDPETGDRDGILTLAIKQKVAPKIFYTFSSYEYWGRAASLIHTNVDGKIDATLPDNVRIYYFVGGQHGPGQFPPKKNQTQNLTSPNDYSWSMRALLVALDAWAKDGTAPPPSQYAKIADGALVTPQSINFPKIPGVNFSRAIHEAWRVDYGPEFKTKGVIANEPPRIGKPFPAMAPQVDQDGIDLGGIRLPEVAVPLATYTGWNPRDPEIGAPDQLVDFAGSYIPFARTKAERERAGDPRLSIEERYTGRDHYLSLVKKAGSKLIKDGYLLAEDLPALVERAGRQWDYTVK